MNESDLPEDALDRAAEVVGTSAVVFPAAGLIEVAGSARARVLEFNMERTAASERVDLGIYGPSGKTLPELLKRI